MTRTTYIWKKIKVKNGTNEIKKYDCWNKIYNRTAKKSLGNKTGLKVKIQNLMKKEWQ